MLFNYLRSTLMLRLYRIVFTTAFLFFSSSTIFFSNLTYGAEGLAGSGAHTMKNTSRSFKFIEVQISGRLFRVPISYSKWQFGVLRRDSPYASDGLDFAFWMPDGQASSRNPISLTIYEWMTPDPGMKPLNPEQYIVLVKLLRPAIPADRGKLPFEQFKRSGLRDLTGEYGLLKGEPDSDKANITEAHYSNGDNDDTQVYFRCSTKASVASGLKDCSGIAYSRPENLIFRIQFPATKLADWKEICRNVNRLAHSWTINDKN